LGGGKIRAALESALATEVGGVSPEGAVRLVAVDCAGESRDEPLVTLDGQAQRGITPKAATELATLWRAQGTTAGAA